MSYSFESQSKKFYLNFFKYTLALFLVFTWSCEDPKDPDIDRDRCGSAEYFVDKMNTDPAFNANFYRIENLIEDYYATVPQGAAGLRGGRIIIPVVVHVLHNGESVGTGTNISDVQIQSQITVMNQDFRRLNADISTVPTAFSGLTADTRMEFQLARRDPTCGATNGITRQAISSTASFTVGGNEAKAASTGGVDPWDTDKYLNMWVVPSIAGSAIGYSSFPNDAANLQGFVCESNVFGNTGSVSPTSAFNLGRTAVHEFGHYFNLQHLEGVFEQSDGSFIIDNDRDGTCEASSNECAGSDFIADTPNQGEPNYGTPTFPVTDCCTTSGDGLMFMNYMDYADDPGMVMFSQDQSLRMVASLYSTQASLIGSDGLIPPPDGGAGFDVFIQDTPEDIGNEPNNESDHFYISEDIWIRNDSGIANQEHETPIYASGDNLYVYVRVRNRGCAASVNKDVKLYWAKASSGLSWTAPWDGSVTIDGAAMGGQIGTAPTNVIPGGDFTILEYEWTNVPDPADYASFGADNIHFCLLARIGPDAEMASTETTNLWNNVKNNNNIAWKNVNILEPGGTSGGREAAIMVGNYEGNREYEMILSFEDAGELEASVFDYGDVFVELAPELMTKWINSGKPGTGIMQVDATRIQINRRNATIGGLLMNPQEIYACTIICIEKQKILGPMVYFLDLKQYEGSVAASNMVGAQRFWLKAWNK